MRDVVDWDAHFKAKLREAIAFTMGLAIGLAIAVAVVLMS